MKAQLAQKKIVQDEQRFARERDEMAALVFRHEFDEKALSKAMVNEIGRLVQCAKSAQLDDLHEKRERYVVLRFFISNCMINSMCVQSTSFLDGRGRRVRKRVSYIDEPAFGRGY